MCKSTRTNRNFVRDLLLTCATLALAAILLLARAERVAADPPPQLSISPASVSAIIGNTTVVTINLTAATNLYGYQFQVNYDASKVNATGAFINNFFDTAVNAFVPNGWNADCAAGICKFAATKLSPATGVTGSGTLARITFTGIASGNSALTFAQNILSDRDGTAQTHASSGGAITINGLATITGTITLQGRTTPITAGTITLTDTANIFPATVVNYHATTGEFTATVPVAPSGSIYNLLAAHSVYLANLKTGVALAPAGIVNAGTTQLKGGDANNDGRINILDLSCMGNAYGGAPTVCGSSGSSDINGNGNVNIFDLVIAGGNYGLASPQSW